MGTRNLTCIFADGEYKVAQYGQWDGYPDVAGVSILSALKETTLEDLKEKTNRCVEQPEEEIKKKWVECGSKADTNLVSMEVSEKMATNYPTLQRDLGYGIVKYLIDTQDSSIPISRSLNFAANSLFCEWCYVVDLDAGTFEIYEGFQTTPSDGRFRDLYKEGNEYYPVALVKTYRLNDLPSEEGFLKDFQLNN